MYNKSEITIKYIHKGKRTFCTSLLISITKMRIKKNIINTWHLLPTHKCHLFHKMKFLVSSCWQEPLSIIGGDTPLWSTGVWWLWLRCCCSVSRLDSVRGCHDSVIICNSLHHNIRTCLHWFLLESCYIKARREWLRWIWWTTDKYWLD